MIKYLFKYSFLVVSFFGYAQQDILDKLEEEHSKIPVYELATFKTTRIGLGHSVELRKKGTVEISLFNRFWNIDQEETTQRFLADEVSIRFGLNYALSDNLTIGAGYTNFDKIPDGFLKYKILRQQKNTSKAPISIVFLQSISHRKKTESFRASLYAEDEIISSEVYGFTSQVLIARKFNQKFSAQITPTYVHRNKSFLVDQPKDQFAIGIGARYKLGGHVSLISEYYQNLNPIKSVSTYNPFLLGVNWELSHLLLQFQMTNARNYAEDFFITQTQNNFNFHDGNFHFGFNAIFVLDLNKNKL